MPTYRIFSRAGMDMGTFDAATPRGAAKAMARDAGYHKKPTMSELVIEEVEPRAAARKPRAKRPIRSCQKITKRGVEITACPGGEDSFTLQAGGARVILDRKGRTLEIAFIEVPHEDRKRRVGTALYEAALEHAKLNKLKLRSDKTRSHFAESFWRKQLAKGRAKCVRGTGYAWRSPLTEAIQRAHRECDRSADPYECHARTKAWRDSLPQPREGDRWPCKHYEVLPGVDELGRLRKRR